MIYKADNRGNGWNYTHAVQVKTSPSSSGSRILSGPVYTIYCELKMSHVSMKSNARHGFLSTLKRQRKKCTPHDSDCLSLFILFLNPTTAYRHSSSQNGRIVDGKHNQTSKCFHSTRGLQIPTRLFNRYSGECPTTRCMLAITPGYTTMLSMLYKGMAWQCKRIRLRVHAYD
jgi:hypothetical protein